MSLWCDGCRRTVALEKWATVFRAAPVFTQQGKRVGWVRTVQHSLCRTVAHIPVRKPARMAVKIKEAG